MWAFVIVDRRRRKLVASRDRFGMKPLFVHRSGQRLLLASEIKAIVASGWYEFAPNDKVVADFLARGWIDHSRQSFFAGIDSLEPATVLEVDFDGGTRSSRYWDLGAVRPGSKPFDAEEFQRLFVDAVRLHLRSDVPVGVHLSGGLDSTAIICAVSQLEPAQQRREPLHAYSFIDPEFDERSYIDATIRTSAATMHELEIAPAELWSSLESMIRQQDEPVHSPTPLVGYLLMKRTARDGVKVILNGQGADEVLAGYGSYFVDYWHSMLVAFGWLKLLAERRSYRALHGKDHPQDLSSIVARAIGTLLRRSRRYLALSLAREVSRLEKGGWLSRDVCVALDAQPPAASPSTLDEALKESVLFSPLPLYLRVEDRNAMAHSVEARLPFLDYRLVEYAFSIADEFKLRGGWNKYMLRESMRGMIPETVRIRPEKMGFPVPTARWVRGPLLEPIGDLLAGTDVLSGRYFDVEALRRMFDRTRRGAGGDEHTLFTFAQTELWLRNARRRVDREPEAAPSTASR
jgi:asparagine synthase (glutamine-hydrolysing)